MKTLLIFLSLLLFSSNLSAAKYYNGKCSTSTSGKLSDSSGQVFPVGMTAPFLGTSVPDGWLECNGAAISRTTYAALFAVISDDYGPGDSSTTFNLPDLRGRFIRGYNHSSGVDPDASSRTDRGDSTTGDNVGTKQGNATKRPTTTYTTNDPGTHIHALWWYASASPNNGALYGGGYDGKWRTAATSSTGAHSHTITGGGDNESRGPNINVIWCIKY